MQFDDEDEKISMLIMLLSHKFGTENNEPDDHSDLPHCPMTFPIRQSLITDQAILGEISSIAQDTKKIDHDEYLATSLARLTQCMQDSCCIESNSAPPSSCTRSTPLSKRTESFST